MSASQDSRQAAAADAPAERRTFLRQLALFAGVFLLVHAGCHLGYRALVDRASIDGRVDREFREHAAGLRTLALGDSHVQAAVVAPDLQDAYNFAAAGESWVFTDAKLDAILPRIGAAERVILPFDPHSFSAFRIAGTVEPAYWNRYVRYWPLALRLDSPALALDGLRGGLASYVGRGAYALHAIRGLAGDDLATLERGYLPVDTDLSRLSAAERSAAAANRIAHHFRDGPRRSQALVDAFESVLQRLDMADLEVVLVSFPLTPEYRNGVPEGTRDWMRAYASEVAARYGVSGWWDASMLFDANPDYFRDTDHLNHRGAGRFTAWLAERADLPVADGVSE